MTDDNVTPIGAAKRRKVVPGSAEALMGMLCTDLGNAERFARRWKGAVRYCHGRKKWLIWSKSRWAWDENGRIERMAKMVVRDLYAEAAKHKDTDERYQLSTHARNSEKASAIANMLRLAQSEDGIPVALEELDANPLLLNCENGTVDLSTGKLKPHDQADLITKLCPCSYDRLSRSSVWEKFLADSTAGDQSLMDYIQRAAGYAIHGEATERALFFTYGPPGSAKSTLIDALGAMLGDYHMATSPDTWLVQAQTGGNRGDLVRLAGSRLVTAVEFKEGSKFDEALIKSVTGGDAVTAAAKYEAEVTIQPTFTLWFAANDSPAIRSGDEGMWARMRRIPFNHVIPKEQQDKSIKRQLKNDPTCRAAVLAWAVAGFTKWQAEGLGSAPAIEQSTKEYQEEMDPIRDFIEGELVFHPDADSTPKEIRLAYDQWAKEEGVKKTLGRKAFQKAIEDRGAKYTATNGKRKVLGVRRKSEFGE